jgi:single-strand DNA-binding protein
MLNLVVLIGNLGAAPDIRTTPSGVKVAKMRLAVNDVWTNRSTGQKEQRTHWVDLNAWDRLAVTAEKFLFKGSKIAIRGTLEYREWSAQDGSKRSKLEVRVRELSMLSSREQGSYNQNRSRNDNETDPFNNSQKSYSPNTDNSEDKRDATYKKSSDYPDYDAPVEDDDIPF